MDPPMNATVGILLVPGFFLDEAAIAYDVFSQVGGGLKVSFVAATGEPVASDSDAKLEPDLVFADPEALPRILVVPGGCGSHASLSTERRCRGLGAAASASSTAPSVPWYGNDTALVAWVTKAAAGADIVMGHGWGSLLLAEARAFAAASWIVAPYASAAQTALLQSGDGGLAGLIKSRRFDVSGKVVTSCGGLATFEASLYVVRHLYGSVKATSLAQSGFLYSADNLEHALNHEDAYRPAPEPTVSMEEDGASWAFVPTVVGILLLDGMKLSELVAPRMLFSTLPNVTAVLLGPVPSEATTTLEGARLFADASLAMPPSLDVLVVPGGIGSQDYLLEELGLAASSAAAKADGNDDDEDEEGPGSFGASSSDGDTAGGVALPAVLKDVRPYSGLAGMAVLMEQAATSAKVVVGSSWGAFTLAGAGMLDRRVATTAKGHGIQLARRFPQITKVDDRTRIVDDGRVITSQGGVAAFEVSLYVVHLLYGSTEATWLARGFHFALDNSESLQEVYVTDSGDFRRSSVLVSAAPPRRTGRILGTLGALGAAMALSLALALVTPSAAIGAAAASAFG